MGQLDGKVALVTGAASGIGKASATRLAGEGARVCVVDVNPAGKEVAGDIGGMFVAADVSDSGQMADAVAACEKELGGLDAAHLNAGVTTGEGDPEALTDEAYRRIMGVNLDGVFFGIRACMPAMVRRGGGSIVATASMAGMIAFPPDPLYTATKHAVVGLVRSFAPTIHVKRVRLNCICPGIADTPLLPEDVKPILVQSGLELIDPDEIAGTVLELTAGTHTGQAIVCQKRKGVYSAEAYVYAPPPGW